jgi:hypothetical protein
VIGHEVAGHDVLLANRGLVNELERRIAVALQAAGLHQAVPYWRARLDEAASDVLGVLNLGPSMSVGLLVFLRGYRGATKGVPRLLGDLPGGDRYPADLIRGVVVRATTARLRCRSAARWGELVDAEVSADLRADADPAFLSRWAWLARSAAIVVQVIAGARLDALGGRSFEELQNWTDRDEELAQALAAAMTRNDAPETLLGPDHYAAHAIAGATYLSLASADLDPGTIQAAMLRLLAAMHRSNPRWRAHESVSPSEPA